MITADACDAAHDRRCDLQRRVGEHGAQQSRGSSSFSGQHDSANNTELNTLLILADTTAYAPFAEDVFVQAEEEENKDDPVDEHTQLKEAVSRQMNARAAGYRGGDTSMTWSCI